MADVLLALTDDPLARRRLDRAAAELGAVLVHVATPAEAAAEPPLAVVIDLERRDAHELVAACKSRWAGAMVAGHLDLPDPRQWRLALDAGCDLVASRGTLARQLVAKVREWRLEPGGTRLRLFATADVAGRIGLVARIQDTPVGPLAVYHVGGDILVAEDRCPHAGAALSEGELAPEAATIDCPKHGSRFDLRTGSRLRGPADGPIKTYRVVVEGTEVHVHLD
jgi:nitrite reductase/ring-hydroxylating ferredoxin subunit